MAHQREDGATIQKAISKKQRTYREVVRSRRTKLLVAAVEVGGRWNDEAHQFLVQLARAKARSAPRVLRYSLVCAWLKRWTSMLAFAAHDALAASIAEESPGETLGTDGEPPQNGELLRSYS